eukprot:GILJ01002821.1.p1 GENE.GILJ01002821.1~~GILJ01002821.1.p1  ORF type:complete len:584 (+),score=75.13 GILJ01002821.1:43-1752(+)
MLLFKAFALLLVCIASCSGEQSRELGQCGKEIVTPLPRGAKDTVLCSGANTAPNCQLFFTKQLCRVVHNKRVVDPEHVKWCTAPSVAQHESTSPRHSHNFTFCCHWVHGQGCMPRLRSGEPTVCNGFVKYAPDPTCGANEQFIFATVFNPVAYNATTDPFAAATASQDDEDEKTLLAKYRPLPGPLAQMAEAMQVVQPTPTPLPEPPKYIPGPTLAKDKFLTAGQQLISANQAFVLTMQEDGNLVLTEQQNRIRWATHTANVGNAPHIFGMQGDGNIAIYDNTTLPVWTSNRTSLRGDYELVLQDDGLLCIRDVSSRLPVWSNGVTADMLAAQTALTVGSYLRSQNNKFTLLLEQDGRLAVWEGLNRPIWISSMLALNGSGFVLFLSNDGNATLHNNESTILWSSDSGGYPKTAAYAMVMQNDGNLVIVNTQTGQPIWASNVLPYMLPTNNALVNNQSLHSANGNFTLTLYSDGNLILRKRSASLWMTNSTGRGNAPYRLSLENDGILHIFEANGQSIWQSNNTALAARYDLVLHNDGTLAVWNRFKNEIVWGVGSRPVERTRTMYANG